MQLYKALMEDKAGGDPGERLTTEDEPVVLYRILSGKEAVWCDNVLTPQVERCADRMRVALKDALKDLQKRLGKHMARWRWGAIHATEFPHNPFSQVDFLRRFFDRSIVTGGDDYTVDPSPYKVGAPFNACWVPSYRQIIDLTDLNNSRFMHATGQSGNVFSEHYDDLIPR